MRSKRAAGHAHFGDTSAGADKDGDVEVFNKHKLGHWETMVADRLGDAYEVVELVVLRHMRLVVSRAIHRRECACIASLKIYCPPNWKLSADIKTSLDAR